VTADTDALSVDDLTEVRKSVKAAFESGVLNPHEKQHMWEVLARIDGLVKERRQQQDAAD
jgi:hypothetical protein